jgi:hypothetical protein
VALFHIVRAVTGFPGVKSGSTEDQTVVISSTYIVVPRKEDLVTCVSILVERLERPFDGVIQPVCNSAEEPHRLVVDAQTHGFFVGDRQPKR